MGVNDDQLIDFAGSPTGFAAVKEGRIDGYATVAMNVEMQLREMKDPGLERADPFEQPVVSGKIRYGITSFAVRLEDKDLLDESTSICWRFAARPNTWPSWRSTA
jgi:polar amino acid transport system substrate-binding protein